MYLDRKVHSYTSRLQYGRMCHIISYCEEFMGRYIHDCALTSIIILSHFLKGMILSVIVNCWAVEPDLQP